MRIQGLLKILAILVLNFLLMYFILGIEIAVILICGVMLYAWLGEYIDVSKDNAIHLDELNDYQRIKLHRVRDDLVQEVKNISNENISGMKLCVVPSSQMNAFSYGFSNIGVTRGTLEACDESTLKAVLGHEISHMLYMDTVFHRIVLADITLTVVGLGIASFLVSSFLWIVFILLGFVGICRGYASTFLFSRGIKAVKGIFSIVQRFVVFAYQVLLAAVSRGCEYRADQYSVTLGYGPQLSYFLNRFIMEQEEHRKTLNEILYDSHPATVKRIQRIKHPMA